MAEPSDTLVTTNENILIDYIDGRRQRAVHDIHVRRIEGRKTITGTYRIYLFARDKSSNKTKTYIFSRIRAITDLSTGEVFDKPADWGDMIVTKYNGIRPQYWPYEYARTTAMPWEIQPKEIPVLKGFAFGITQGHLIDFDIGIEEIPAKKDNDKKKEFAYTIGDPPRLNFSVGSVYHMPPLSGEMKSWKWGDQKKILDYTIQVKESAPNVSEEEVTIQIIDHIVNQTSVVTIPQINLFSMLKTGAVNHTATKCR